MEKLSLHKNDDKFKAVAGQLSKERKYDLARNMKKVWNERRDLFKIGNKDDIQNWRRTIFFQSPSSELVAPSSIPSPLEPSEKSSSTSDVDASSESVVEMSDSSVPTPLVGSVPSLGGRPKKRLSDNPGAKTENNIIDGFLEMIEDFATQEKVSPRILLQKMVDRSRVRWGPADSESPKERDVPVEDACALIYNMNFSIQQYQKLRNTLRDHNIDLPTRNEVDVYKKKLFYVRSLLSPPKHLVSFLFSFRIPSGP